MSDVQLKTGDTSPAVTATLTSPDGTAINVSAADVRFQMEPALDPDAGLTVDAPATIMDGDAGRVRYDWQAGDTVTPGRYHGEFVVDHHDGTTETVPNDGYFIIQILPRLSGGF